MYRCETSGTSHICDSNCDQCIYYDAHTQICRLSRKLFPKSQAAFDPARKRASENGEPRHREVKRVQSSQWPAAVAAAPAAAPAWTPSPWTGSFKQQ
ncbi:hypothetical protein WJX72_012440 [[Myrmecia] bisecta]|uniref:Uncharacterized protein n=1 Tax=[Myrmecia] bisecta TaxID=41462 RepID=A0AAW1QGX9_9CHLO